MAIITAGSNPIVVDNKVGAVSAATTIKYEKGAFDVYWHRIPGAQWTKVNLFVLVGAPKADEHGSYTLQLQPGQFYEAGIFTDGFGPLDSQHDQLAGLVVRCILGSPKLIDVVTGQSHGNPGGTFYSHVIDTTVPTSIGMIAVSREPISIGKNGLPIVGKSEGNVLPKFIGEGSSPTIGPLLPGNHYFFVAMIVDEFGNWQLITNEFDTLRRKVEVTLPKLHVINDGDENFEGECRFAFRISIPFGVGSSILLQEFSRPEETIDDGSDIPLGFAYIGPVERVNEGQVAINVSSNGIEDDSPFGEDHAGNLSGVDLPFPIGRSEQVIDRKLLLDCPATSDGSSFHYTVDIVYSVNYVA